MKGFRVKMETWFEGFAKLIIRFHWFVLLLILAWVGFSLAQFPNIKFDTATEGFFHKDDPVLAEFNAYRDQFGRDEMLVIMVRSDNIFSQEFLTTLKELHNEIEDTVPNLNDVTSLVNARLTKGAEGQLIVQDLLEDFPETPEAMEALKQQVLSHPLYKNQVISENGEYTVILIKTEAYTSEGSEFMSEDGAADSGFDTGQTSDFGTESQAVTVGEERQLLTDEENSAIVVAVEELVTKYNAENFELSYSGSPVVTDFLKKDMQKDMRKFTLMAIGAIGFFLFLMFRRSSGVLLPLLTVIFSVISTIGFMSFVGVPLKMPTMILPSFILAVGIGATVHLMALFYKKYDGTNKNESIIWAMGHSGLPILMTSLTTAAGLASFSRAEIAPIADLGMFASFGVMISMVLTLTLIPSFVSFMPIRPTASSKPGARGSRLDKVLIWMGDFANQKPWPVVIFCAILLVVALGGLTKLTFSHNTLKWFPKSSDIRLQTEMVDREMKGSITMSVIVETKEENGLYNPKILNGLDQLGKEIMKFKQEDGSNFFGKTIALSDMLKEINQALNENKPEHYSIPSDSSLIAQEFLLFENSGSDDLKDIVDTQFKKTHITAKGAWQGAELYVQVVDDIGQLAKEIFGEDVKVTPTGIVILFSHTITSMINSMKVSYSIAAVVISIMMILLLGRVGLGLFSMIPNFLPIVIVLGFMGWAGVSLDMFTLLIGSIAIGLAVDDTIHFFHNYQKYYDETGSAAKAIEHTLATTGRAMLVTTTVLTLGFWLFMFANMNNLFYFGLLTGSCMILAFLADIVMAPAMLTLIARKKNTY